jgi:hypothetical protein
VQAHSSISEATVLMNLSKYGWSNDDDGQTPICFPAVEQELILGTGNSTYLINLGVGKLLAE